jgi:polyisoprenyl-phosphate glycosyltransferase
MISVVIPCLNEREVLPELHVRLAKASETWGEPCEVIAVDDGSTDGTWSVLEGIAADDPRWKIIRLGRNFGHQAALSAGIHHASGDAVVSMDADLQDPPEVIGLLIERWREGYDVVYGIRRSRKENALKRLLFFCFYRVLDTLADTHIPRDCGDFSLIDRRAADLLDSMPERHRFLRGLRAWIGLRQTGLEYERAARAAGRTKYGCARLVQLAFNGIFSFSIVPLRALSCTGALLSLLSILGAAFYIYRRLAADVPVPGFASLIIAVLFLGGAQLVALGIIGEYVGRIYEEAKGRPLWTVRQKKGFP